MSCAIFKPRPAIEWPTLSLALFIYASWAALTYHQAALPWWVVTPLGAWLLAWHTSMQHEILHGHPTKWRGFNRILASVPLCLWLPYESYRISHLIHHRDERLTDPFDDPETYYWTTADWASLSPAARWLVKAQTTLLGRLVIGPFWIVPRYFWHELKAIRAGNVGVAGIWMRHTLQVTMVLLWLIVVCKMNMLFYVLGVVYPGASLMLLRSFAEHRAAADPKQRTAITENAGIFGWLYLYNNLHSVHHEDPMIPWYEYTAAYKANRERILQENGHLLYNGYGDVARRYLLRAHDAPVHPLDRAP